MKFIKANSGKIIEGKGYDKEILIKDIDLISSTALAQLIVIKPKTTVADHYHKESTEIFYFLTGSVTFNIEGQKVFCEPGDLLVCEKNEIHEVTNESNYNVRYLAIKTQGEKDTFWK